MNTRRNALWSREKAVPSHGPGLGRALEASYRAGLQIGQGDAFEQWLKAHGWRATGNVFKVMKWRFEQGAEDSRRQGHDVIGAGQLKDGSYKGERIWFDGNYWRTSMEPESSFESQAEVKRWIDWQRKHGNPKRSYSSKLGRQAREAASLVSPETYAGAAGEVLGSVLDKAKGLFNPKGKYKIYRAVDSVTGECITTYGNRYSALADVELWNAYARVHGQGERYQVKEDYTDTPPVRGRGHTNPRTPIAQWSASQINKRLDRLDQLSSANTEAFIAAGRGYERPPEYLTKTDPLSLEARRIHDEKSDLHAEIERRYGPGAPSRLPTDRRGFFGPIKRINPGNVLTAWLIYGKHQGRVWITVEPIQGPDGWIHVHGAFPRRPEAEAAVLDVVDAALKQHTGHYKVAFRVRLHNHRGRVTR